LIWRICKNIFLGKRNKRPSELCRKRSRRRRRKELYNIFFLLSPVALL